MGAVLRTLNPRLFPEQIGYIANHSGHRLAGQLAEYARGGFDENAAFGLCYTPGTTGNPRGVLYSHQSDSNNVLMTLKGPTIAVAYFGGESG